MYTKDLSIKFSKINITHINRLNSNNHPFFILVTYPICQSFDQRFDTTRAMEKIPVSKVIWIASHSGSLRLVPGPARLIIPGTQRMSLAFSTSNSY